MGKRTRKGQLSKPCEYFFMITYNIAALTNMYMVTLHNREWAYIDNVIFPSQ